MNFVKGFLGHVKQTSTIIRVINCSCISCDQNGLDDAPLGLQPLKGLAGK
ncbi:MAG: hypothetical protein O4861_16805 [Trichodesmium sp. St16_bin4-tuft]|nr:hypothetical protein [Trichodesmium sp. St2_bin6]MDE5091374.1 hypothetical protein [Trichodesmium sp. St18_bin3_1_1]MDE5099895.1 hypothetical protein [Trichodesmium sp. St16_bin4-tuft]MDE5103220.1 hypothetical protein [Trichodesmium sp. St19_bin2]